MIDVDHPTPSPEPSVQTSTPARSPPYNNHRASQNERPAQDAQVWASPAFLKRSNFLAASYDPFEDDFPDNDRRKRTRFGRGSGQWRFAERTPSPAKESETPPFDVTSPSRLSTQDDPREEELTSRIQQAYSIESPSKASIVATNGLTDRNELEIQAEIDPTTKRTSIGEDESPSISLSQVNSGGDVLHEVTRDEDIGSTTVVEPTTPHTEADHNKTGTQEVRRESDGSMTRPKSPTSISHDVGDELPHVSAQVVQALASEPIEILSLASSSESERYRDNDEKSDREFDDVSDQESDSLFDEQSESGQSNAAMYSGPASDFGVDGSVFSRPPPSVEFAPPPSVVEKLEQGLEADSLKTDDAWDIPSPLQSAVERLESEAEELSIPEASVSRSSASEDKDSWQDIDMLEGQEAAQRRSSLEMPSFDESGSPEAREVVGEASENTAAKQLLTGDNDSWKDVDILPNRYLVQQSSSNPPSSHNESKSRESQEELTLRSQQVSDDQVKLEVISRKSLADSSDRKTPFYNQEEIDLSAASDNEEIPRSNLEIDQVDSTLRQESPYVRQQEMARDARLIQEDSNTVLTQGHEDRDSLENLDTVPSAIQQTTVEIIDLESGDEDVTGPQRIGQQDLENLDDKNDSRIALVRKAPAHVTPLPVAFDVRKEHRTLTDEASRLPTPSDSALPTLKPATAVEDILPADIQKESEGREEPLKPEQEDPRNQPPTAKSEGYQEELQPMKDATLPRLQEARLKSKESDLPSEEKPRLKYSAAVETELRLISTDDLPSTVPDSLEDTRSKSHLLTPSSTQQTNSVSQSPSVSVHSAPEDDTLPTPRLTQGTSTSIIPLHSLAPPEEAISEEIPAPPKKTSALIEKLKAMRRLSSQSPKPRSSQASVLDPWFAPRRSIQVIPDSDDGSEAESSPEREMPANILKKVVGQPPETPEKPLAKTFIRSPPPPKCISSVQSSPQYLPPSQPPPPGFRTTLSYFVPLATLPSHFATTVDILAIALSSTPVTRATSGPRDYNQNLYVTDPSSFSLRDPITTAQIFRPNNRCFPLVENGDALLLRDFKVQSFQKRLLLLSTDTSAWSVFRKGANVQIRGPPVEFGAEERGFARGLWDWWASLGDDARKRLEDAVPEHKSSSIRTKTAESKVGGKKQDTPPKTGEIEGLGINLPGSQGKTREPVKERSLALDGVEERDMLHESIEAPTRVLRARGAKGANGRSESALESRFGTVFTGGLGEPDETQGSAHELRDGKAYRMKRS